MKLNKEKEDIIREQIQNSFLKYLKFHKELNSEKKEFQLLVKYIEKDFKRKIPNLEEDAEKFLYDNLHSQSKWRERDTKPLQITSFILVEMIKFIEKHWGVDEKNSF